MAKRILALLLVSALAACSRPKPVLYPNEFYKARTNDEVHADVNDCQAKAKEYLKTNKNLVVAKHVGFGAAVGAFFGVIFGAFTGNYARAVSEGAAVGAASGLVHGAVDANSPDGITRAFTDRCLADKGYQPIGWK